MCRALSLSSLNLHCGIPGPHSIMPSCLNQGSAKDRVQMGLCTPSKERAERHWQEQPTLASSAALHCQGLPSPLPRQ